MSMIDFCIASMKHLALVVVLGFLSISQKNNKEENSCSILAFFMAFVLLNTILAYNISMFANASGKKQGLPNKSYYPTDASMKKLMHKDFAKQPNNKHNSPSIVARLMGMDLLPLDAKPKAQLPLQDKNVRVSAVHASIKSKTKSKSKSTSKMEYRSSKETYFQYGSSGMNSGKQPRPRVHPQEKELQKFKKEFEAWQAARFLECARVVQLGNIPEQWLAQLDLTKEKMALYETSRKETIHKSRSLRGADFGHLGYKKDVFLAKHRESHSFSGISPGRDLEELSWKDSDINSEKSSRIVILKPGPDSFSTNDESWVTSSCSMEDDRDCIEDLLEEVRERLKYEMQDNPFKMGSVVRGGGIETPFKEKRAYGVKETRSPVAKHVKENPSRDSSRKLFRAESARFYQNESLMSELAPSSPEYMSRETRRLLSERLRHVLDGEKDQNLRVSSDGSPMEPVFDDSRRRLEKARDILNAAHGSHSWRGGTYNADPHSRSFRSDLSDDGNIQEQPSPRSLVRSLSAPVSGMSFGKLLLEDRHVSSGAHIKRKHEAFENLSMDVKDQRKERFNLREKVSSLKHSLSLRKRLFSRKLESMELSESNEFDLAKNIMNEPTVITRFNDRLVSKY